MLKKENLKVGLRTIKTVLSVMICFVINEFRTGGIPFYSAIAAISCMQNNIDDSFKVATNRTISTLLGGMWGMSFVLLDVYLLPSMPNIYRELIISLMLILVIQTSVIFNLKKSAYLSCVVFLSITITHGFDANPILFAINRIVDTLIGIIVSLVINRFFKQPKIKIDK